MGQEEQFMSMITTDNFSSRKINRHFFDFQYIIGKGGFGKVINILLNNKSYINYRYGKSHIKEQEKYTQ